ncbi:simple sugar transport system ATP-binding protein [Labrys monachus]|uniref:Simple sugar transport system ATP-binding protein n=1 Tax=Labrys monachus TaxID=217067 RepID=A0ABU0FGD9_9HYPH|nr:simple sugar transport system ATP-binding protein [Labrys monachus]
MPLIEARGIVKIFGTLRANDGIDLKIMPHEIHALLGENGAGKSTFVKILYGLLQPNEGQLLWQGRPVHLPRPAAARALGIGMVFQHFSLFDNLTVAENVALAQPPGTRLREVEERIAAVSAAYGLPLEPRRPVYTLSVGERQRIEIVRCLMQDPKLLILDEPTSVLTPQEADQLFVTLERIAGEGRAVLYISHRLDEVRRLCQTATVLRHGKLVATCDPRKETAASLARLMVGADIGVVGLGRPADESGPVRLEVQSLSLPAEDLHGVALKDISLAVRSGEVVAIAGVAGNGQSELFAALSGERVVGAAAAVKIDGKPVGRLGVTGRRRLGAAFVPEERLGHASVPRMPLSRNALLTGHATGGLVSYGLIDMGKASQQADTISRIFQVRKGKADPEAGALSGGNLQKFVVGREMLREPSLLIINQPTWGVDAGAAALIHQALIDLARRGSAVIVISQDLDEIFQIADRISVIHDGRLSQPEPARGMSMERIGLLMGGAAHAH